MKLHGHTILILGLGDSGLAMARWCAHAGAAVRVADSRAQPPRLAELAEQVPQAVFLDGGLPQHLPDEVSRVLKSPGLSPLDPLVAPLLAQATERGVPVQGELDLWWQALVGLRREHGYRPRVLAITGTNGKTTVTALAALLVARAGLRVAMAGNVGPTLLQVLTEHLTPALALAEPLQPVSGPDVTDAAGLLDAQPAQRPSDDAANTSALSDEPHGSASDVETDADVPHVSAVDMVSTDGPSDPQQQFDATAGGIPDAADEADEAGWTLEERPLPIRPPKAEPEISTLPRHMPQVWVLELSSFQLDGVQGFEPDAAVVLNLSEDHLDWHGNLKAYAQAKGRIYAGRGVLIANRDDAAVMALRTQYTPLLVRGKAQRVVTSFGLDAPQAPGDYGLLTRQGMDWLVRAQEADETIKRRKGEQEELHIQTLMPADALHIRGRHNAANALAALALATAIGCPLAPMLHGLRDYRGEPHRLESVATLGGVEFYDDSKGTNVGATVAALGGLAHEHGPGARLLVILGGDGKGQDFTPLAAAVAGAARFVALVGRDAGLIEQALIAHGRAAQVERLHCGSLEEAVQACAGRARSGDAVLLSPACASLDMFRNYGHRAEVFVRAVQDWAAQQGEVLA